MIDMDKVPSLAPGAIYYEQGILDADTNPEVTLMLQLTHQEVAVVSYGLYWLHRLYGEEMVADLGKKFSEVVTAQEFCNCPSCQALNADREEEAPDGS